KETEELFMQVIETRKRVFRAEYLNTLTSINNLGRSNKAISLLAKYYKLRKRILGSRHPFTLSSLRVFNKWRIVN
ncbi:uncharacterized protein K441DRAFT_545671, partial [Cenococcum geophilum 1.58]|uniref:uncharacterized protein n=1 Tax=Cenococcum geophilum 1.58 TaxID=794803 RepID=UPI00358F62DE